MNRRVACPGALLLLAALAACRAGPAPLAEHAAATAQRWDSLAAEPDRAVVSLEWTEAVQRMEAGNLKLRQAREAVRLGEEAVRQVPRNYLPELSLNAFANPAFSTLGDGRLGDTFFFLGGVVSLPNPVRYRAEALQARLQFMAAQADAELLRRDLHARLYRLFRQAGVILRHEVAHAALARLAADAPGGATAAESRELARQDRAAWRTIEPELADLLGDYTRRWRPGAAPDLPQLDYAAHPPALNGRDHFAALQLTRAALQLLALDAQRQGLLVAEWPQVSVLLSAPPLYQRAAGRESYLSLGDLHVAGFISYGTDFRGSRALGRTQAARRAELTRHELDTGLAGTMSRLRDGLALLAETAQRLAGLRAAEAALRQSGAVVAADDLARQAEELSTEADELNLSFWVLDESRWPRPT